MDHHEVVIDTASPQPDVYARANGLSVDSQVDISLLLSDFREQSTLLESSTEFYEVDDDLSLPQLQIAYLLPRTEQLSISRESLELLRDVALLGNKDIQEPRLATSKLRDLAKLKLEPPLLRSDPEHDCRELARSVHERRRPDIDLSNVPSEPLNTSPDEGLDFPETAFKYRQSMVTAIQDEKIDVSKEILHYLSCTLRDTWTEDKQRELLEEVSYKKTVRDLAITPPLSPNSPKDGCFVPDAEACQVPILSDPSTLLDDDLNRAEAGLLERDHFHAENLPVPQSGTPVVSPLEELPLLELRRPNLSSLKVEGPLTPLDSLPPSSELAIDMTGLMQETDIDEVLKKAQLDLCDAKGEKDPDGIFSDDTLAILKDVATSVTRSIEQERLQTADAIARIDIPTMDFSIPGPDWQHIPLGPKSHLRWIEKNHEAFNVNPWPKDPKAERELRWAPFSSRLGRISTKESIDDAENVKEFLDFSGLHSLPTSADYVWKRPGLAILRDPEEGEEEEEEEQLNSHPAYGEDRDLESLVRKRRLELSDPRPESEGTLDPASPIDLVRVPEDTAQSSRVPSGGHERLSNLLLGCDDPSATSTLLSNYVDFHTKKRQKSSTSCFFPNKTKPTAQSNEAPTSKATIAASKTLEVIRDSGHNQGQMPVEPAPCPTLVPTSAKTKIIKALTLERGVFSRLEKLYPNTEIIERDFDRWNSMTWNRNSILRSPVASPLAAEADVIVSPITGIVVTTLLKAMQKPVPGQKKGLAAIRERIRSVALRYERLVVLVSEANRVDETARDLTPAECVGYTDFTGFVAGLDTDTQVYYVGGGNETLTKWLVSFLTRYAPEAAAVGDVLIQDETLWELFLRRAGLNAYAAQAILGRLKPPEDASEGEGVDGRYGLPAFVRMGPERRVKEFHGLMGGERVLRRVNEVLEMQWGD
ncbi:hypothetical protein AAE478_000649 [Parahypoxylon ruwenzoriense]